MANVVDLRKVKYGLVDYGSECAITRIDIPAWRTMAGVRWTYELMFEVVKTAKGINYEHDRACGFARAAVISARPEPIVEYPLVDIPATILTPYGEYTVDWYSRTDHDNLKLVEQVLQEGQRVWIQGVVDAPGENPVPPCQAEIIKVDDPLILREVLADGSLDQNAELYMETKMVFSEAQWAVMSDAEKLWDPEVEEE